jgi:UDP-2,4-diacetamido-2,4,6-trideoxy-beta-L-altropyranose hydrolase
MRCLTLARALPQKATIEFVCREQVGDMCGVIEACGYRVHRLPEVPVVSTAVPPGHLRLFGVAPEQDAVETMTSLAGAGVSRPEWLIVDHYDIDSAWETAMRPHVDRVFVIDDLANRAHDCDLLLDQNFYDNAAERYSSWVCTSTRCLLGPRFALLRPEFAATRNARHEAPSKERLFVSFGGHDQNDASVLVVEALRLLGRAAPAADVVAGMDERLLGVLARLKKGLPDVAVHGFVKDIERLMSSCTFAVGAGGGSTWERCVLGLPSLVIVTADNQRRMAQDLANFGAIINLGDVKDIAAKTLAKAIDNLGADKRLRESLRAAAMALVDGGGTLRVVGELTGAMACST